MSGFNKEYDWEKILKACYLLLSLLGIWLTIALDHCLGVSLVRSELLNLHFWVKPNF